MSASDEPGCVIASASGKPTIARSARSAGSEAASARSPYYLTPKSAPWAYKRRYSSRRKRDLAAVHNPSYALSGALRKMRRAAWGRGDHTTDAEP